MQVQVTGTIAGAQSRYVTSAQVIPVADGQAGAEQGGNGNTNGGPITECPPGTSWTGQYDGHGNYYCGTWDEIGWD
ncbi:hypothetical protein ACXR2T_07600 [Leucobacter sp. HY1910]